MELYVKYLQVKMYSTWSYSLQYLELYHTVSCVKLYLEFQFTVPGVPVYSTWCSSVQYLELQCTVPGAISYSILSYIVPWVPVYSTWCSSLQYLVFQCTVPSVPVYSTWMCSRSTPPRSRPASSTAWAPPPREREWTGGRRGRPAQPPAWTGPPYWPGTRTGLPYLQDGQVLGLAWHVWNMARWWSFSLLHFGRDMDDATRMGRLDQYPWLFEDLFPSSQSRQPSLLTIAAELINSMCKQFLALASTGNILWNYVFISCCVNSIALPSQLTRDSIGLINYFSLHSFVLYLDNHDMTASLWCQWPSPDCISGGRFW